MEWNGWLDFLGASEYCPKLSIEGGNPACFTLLMTCTCGTHTTSRSRLREHLLVEEQTRPVDLGGAAMLEPEWPYVPLSLMKKIVMTTIPLTMDGGMVEWRDDDDDDDGDADFFMRRRRLSLYLRPLGCLLR